MWLYERCAPTFPEYQLTGAGAGPVSGAAGQGWTLSGCGGMWNENPERTGAASRYIHLDIHKVEYGKGGWEKCSYQSVDGRTIIANLLLVTNTWKNDVMYDDIRRYGHPWRVAW